MQLIDAEEVFCSTCEEKNNCQHVFCDVKHMPTIDAVEVVRCKDCIHWAGVILGMRCKYHSSPPNSYTYKQADDFCSKGERRADKCLK